jgi:protein-tyrosine-phosphatase
MNQVKRVIFVAGSGTSRAPMAAAIFRQMAGEDKIEVLARGIVVQFPEPMNQKAEAILISNGLQTDGFEAVQISDDDITEDTLIFVMEESQRLRVIQDVERATEENTFVLSQFVGDELEILDPYGAPLQSYGLCFEVIKKSIEKLLLKL